MRACIALFALMVSARSACAQLIPHIELRPPAGAVGIAVAMRDVLSEKPFDELLRNGFPTSLHFRAEVWTEGRWFDEVVDRAEWDVRVTYDLLDHSYDVFRIARSGLTSLGTYAQFADARAASELLFTPTLNYPVGKKGYVTVRVDVVTLDNTDLAEMQRWLKGEAKPAVQGKRNPGTALTNGLRTLISRLLGGEARHFDKQSAVMVF